MTKEFSVDWNWQQYVQIYNNVIEEQGLHHRLYYVSTPRYNGKNTTEAEV